MQEPDLGGWSTQTIIDFNNAFDALLEQLNFLRNTKKFNYQELADALEVPVEDVNNLFGFNNLNGGDHLKLRAAVGALILLQQSPDIFDMRWYPQFIYVHKIAVRKFPNGICLVDSKGPLIVAWNRQNTKEKVVSLLKKIQNKPEKVTSPSVGLQWRDGKGNYLFLPTRRKPQEIDLILEDLFGAEEEKQNER